MENFLGDRETLRPLPCVRFPEAQGHAIVLECTGESIRANAAEKRRGEACLNENGLYRHQR